MTSTANKVSARERARSATAARLAEEQARIKQNEDDLAAFFKADENSEKAQADADARIARIREETNEKLLTSDATRASSLAALKSRGESVASIATMTGLTSTEVNKLLKLARTTGATPAKDSSKADSTKKDEKASAEPASTSSDSSPTTAAS